jgi:Fe2+ transport system protein FeoA
VSLAQAPRWCPVRVTGIRGAGPMTYRLMEMGLIEGALVQVLGCAPLGDPLHVRLGDYDLSLRREEAALVDIVSM